jgi:hypothetical protein
VLVVSATSVLMVIPGARHGHPMLVFLRCASNNCNIKSMWPHALDVAVAKSMYDFMLLMPHGFLNRHSYMTHFADLRYVSAGDGARCAGTACSLQI